MRRIFLAVVALLAAAGLIFVVVSGVRERRGDVKEPAAQTPGEAAGAEQIEPQDAAEKLSALGLFQGSDAGFELDRAPTRLEALIMVIRLTGNEEAALISAANSPFVDLPGWDGAGSYASYALRAGLTEGVSETELGAEGTVTAAEFLTFVTRGLGWTAAGEAKARELGLCGEGEFDGRDFTRGDCAVIAWRALSAQTAGGGGTLRESLDARGFFDAPEKYVLHERVPILMYHVVQEYTDEPGTLQNLYLDPKDFEAQLDYFEENGITPVSMRELADHWLNQKPLPAKPVVLTFDDGYLSMYTEVFPRLRDRGWTGTFYLHTGFVGTGSGMTEDMVREMADAGMEIGSHTVSHLDMTTLSDSQIASELSESKRYLERVTGISVVSFCYPAGENNDACRAATENAGYLSAVTTASGIAANTEDIYGLSRIRVNYGDGAAVMKTDLSPLGY